MNYSINYTFLILAYFTVVSASNNNNKCSYKTHLSRTLDSLGFHRKIYYNFSIKSNCKISQCRLCVLETLPNGLFVNQDQLLDFVRLGKLVASVDGTIDVETPAEISSPFIVQILGKVSETFDQSYNGNITLPVHSRYHSPQSGGGVRKVTIRKPEVYIHCPEISFPVKEGIFLTRCADNEGVPLPFSKVSYTIDNDDKLLIWEIPVGDSDNLLIVQTATAFVTLVGFVYITGVILKI